MDHQYDYDGLEVVPNSNPHDAPEVYEPSNGLLPSDRKVEGLEVGDAPADISGRDKIVASSEAHKRTAICGLRRTTFWIVAAIAAIVVIGAVVGGAVGATRKSSDNSAASSPSATSSPISPTTISTSTSTAASATATAGLARNCTSSTNGTMYTSYFVNGLNGAVSATAGLVFQELCGMVTADGFNLAEVPLSAFEQCIELCASWNFWNSSTQCHAADYRHSDGECWLLANVTQVKADTTTAVDVAVFDSAAIAAKITAADPNSIPNPISNCIDNATYTSLFTDGANGAPPSGAGLTFQKHCNQDTDLTHNMAQVYLPTFDTCIELCASVNFWSNSTKCDAATYSHESGFCWVKGLGTSTFYNSQVDLATLI